MNTSQTVLVQILELIQQERLPVGTHLAAQKIADRLSVSRSPVNEALKALDDMGMVSRKENRGYFLAKEASAAYAEIERATRLHDSVHPVEAAYFAIADDLLVGNLPMTISENTLRSRYRLTSAQLQAVLARVSNEGWINRKPGYGWEFSSMMTSPDSLLQSYRMRLALEPAALLEPGYRISQEVIERCREAELHLLHGGIDTDTADQLHDRGVRFHEALVEASGNPFFIDTIKRVNKVRRLLSYRSMRNRSRYREHCEQHLEILQLLEDGKQEAASQAMRAHLQSTLRNLERISDILQSSLPPAAAHAEVAPR